MGCTSSSSPSISDIGEKASVDLLYMAEEVSLTEQQKKILVKNWKFISRDLTGRGTRIFLVLFEKNPFIKSLFPFAKLEGDDLLRDPSFVAHAARFMQALGSVIDNINNFREVLSPMLIALGRRHTNFKGFKPGYFNHFEEAILDVFAKDLGSRFSSQSKEAWKAVLRFILMELKRGFTQMLRERGQQREISEAASNTISSN